MSEHDGIADLVRAVRARVPMDAAQMLIKETPERIGAVFAELPQLLVDRIKAYLPPELQFQAEESRAEVVEDFDREVYGRVPKDVPKVTWEVTATTEEKVGDIPAITKKLVGHVDNA